MQEIDEMLAGSFTAADDEELLQELNDIDTEEAAAVDNAMPDAPGVCCDAPLCGTCWLLTCGVVWCSRPCVGH